MSELNKTLNDMKTSYGKVFLDASNVVQTAIDSIKPKNFDGEIFDSYEEYSIGRNWQIDTLKFLENELSREVFKKWQDILKLREDYSCKGCAVCCKLACSEFSYEELKKKAENGDNFAKQFVSVFIPYNSKDEAKNVYPEYIDLLDSEKEGNVYFYHCPKINEDNRCSDYENRPNICRSFPDNPFCILPKSCGFNGWKSKVEHDSMLLHAIIGIIGYYKEKIELVINSKSGV